MCCPEQRWQPSFLQILNFLLLNFFEFDRWYKGLRTVSHGIRFCFFQPSKHSFLFCSPRCVFLTHNDSDAMSRGMASGRSRAVDNICPFDVRLDLGWVVAHLGQGLALGQGAGRGSRSRDRS